MTPYEQWQLDNYGDILPEYDNPMQPVDNDEANEQALYQLENYLHEQYEKSLER